MSAVVSVRLDDAAQAMLEIEAEKRQLGLSAAIRELACEAAKEAKRRRVREGSARVARHIAENPEAAEFMEFWTTPRVEGL
jgi:hypothetical protein